MVRKPFLEVTSQQSGLDLFQPLVGRGCAYLDYDGDGDQDLVLVENNGPARLLRNDNSLKNNWLRLHLVGTGPTTNRDALGAHVTVTTATSRQHRYLSGATGYLSQSELTLTFGLGTVTQVEKVSVRWPGKDAPPIQEWRHLQINRLHHLVQSTQSQK